MWEVKDRTGGSFILNVLYVVCEGHMKFPGGFQLPAWMQVEGQGT